MKVSQLREGLSFDRRANVGYPKSQCVLSCFRIAQYLKTKQNPLARVAYLAVAIVYKFGSEWILGIEIPVGTQIGPGLRLRHGVGVVLNPHAKLGRNVMIRQGVTVGNRSTEFDCPTIGDDVELGAGSTIIGPIVIGRGAKIGAGAVVVSDIAAGAIVHVAPVVVRQSKKVGG